MMIWRKLLATGITVATLLGMYLFYGSNTVTAERPVEPEPVIVKVPTRADTLVMQYDTLITSLLDSA
ncbi:MAG: hypothetical protein LC655_01190, partial [Bacteroidales bacterium]|nr:hypothetical protein [Bacteroidales bacterium]